MRQARSRVPGPTIAPMPNCQLSKLPHDTSELADIGVERQKEIRMQLIDTQVSEINNGMVTVEFRGEGGELVSVRTVAAHGEDDDAAIVHAKAVLVQLASFGEDADPK
jgi:hypothetical protein